MLVWRWVYWVLLRVCVSLLVLYLAEWWYRAARRRAGGVDARQLHAVGWARGQPTEGGVREVCAEPEEGGKNGVAKTRDHLALVASHDTGEVNKRAANGVPQRGSPTVLIAYATQSQNALILAHKLFNRLTSILGDQQQLHQSKGAGQGGRAGGCGCALDLEATSLGRCCASPGKANGGRGDDYNNGCCHSDPLTRVTPEIKILELKEAASGDHDPRWHAAPISCSVDTLLEDSSCLLIIFIASTFTDGAAPPLSQTFETLFRDAYEDHRVPRDALSKKRFALFGLGDIAYGEKNFNAFAKNLHLWCRGLGAPPFVVPPVYATESNTASLFQVFALALEKWLRRVEFLSDNTLRVCKKTRVVKGDRGGSSASLGVMEASSAAERDPRAGGSENKSTAESSSDDGASNDEDGVDDVEDLVWDEASSADRDAAHELPPLLYPKLQANLTKQGYHLVGTHSAVKLCRWTKAMLRGRGGCYKHTFYNINSSQCMEMTPSLACANKCVFCWRHHTNPVSRTFRWRQDPPEALIAGGIAGHQSMIKQMRGVPGVTAERLTDAMHIRHCALSLVGEPIMYPRINDFCDLLHQRNISSFMVTNAQFPEQLRDLKPVTQLYLSIDAPTPEELKRIDRPLFEDYWERCLECVKEIKQKKQRTVFRLTLVNQYNMENIAAYADLVDMGWPDFIEVKGVTYCGTSNNNTLTMKENVPRHDEVIQFCTLLCEELARRRPGYVAATMTPQLCPLTREDDPDIVVLDATAAQRPYHIACEHEHSCCVLIAQDKFFFNQRWNTWIDYEKFFVLAAAANAALQAPHSDYASARGATFTSLDYTAPTPHWATFNSQEKGFDPTQTRVLRKNGRPGTITSGC